ncbi:MAG: 2-(1,2-epoxy-1,2-dihydrophenyl)acetyl-CoA isomerase [Rhizobiaceae bacterium]|nr:2-(1,2-epoxy-1,2-dihydrophenyl)acetyl-CoA isomerase [Rhizobiaceae bacterium]
MDDTVIHEQRDGYDVLTLNQPERLNPFNERQHQALAAALDRIEQNRECRVVVLTGAGRGFCAGQDLGERDFTDTSQKYDLGAGLEKYYNPLVRRLRALDQPVICAVNGVAAGAGANIALAGDIVIAARSASFIQIFARIGLIPDAGGTWWLTQRLGEARAKALALTTEPLPAEKAAEWGLIWKVVDDDQLMKEAEALAVQLANGPTAAYALAKKAIQAASSNSLDAQLDLERELQREAGYSDDYREGVAAFREKRKANFRGR